MLHFHPSKSGVNLQVPVSLPVLLVFLQHKLLKGTQCPTVSAYQHYKDHPGYHLITYSFDSWSFETCSSQTFHQLQGQIWTNSCILFFSPVKLRSSSFLSETSSKKMAQWNSKNNCRDSTQGFRRHLTDTETYLCSPGCQHNAPHSLQALLFDRVLAPAVIKYKNLKKQP